MIERNYSISLPMLEYFLQESKLACIFPYLEIVHYYSSKYRKSQLTELSKRLDKNKPSVKRQLEVLEKLGLLINHNNGWFFAKGKKKFNIGSGICHSKMVEIPDEFLVNTKKLRTFAYAVLYEQAARHIYSNKFKSKKQQNHTKRGSVPIAGTFMQKFKKNHVDRKPTTWNSQRGKAAKLKILTVQRKFEVLKTGGLEIKKQVLFDRPYLENGYKHTWFSPKRGVYEWRVELPAHVFINLDLKKQRHSYSKEDIQIIKHNHQFRFGSQK